MAPMGPSPLIAPLGGGYFIPPAMRVVHDYQNVYLMIDNGLANYGTIRLY